MEHKDTGRRTFTVPLPLLAGAWLLAIAGISGAEDADDPADAAVGTLEVRVTGFETDAGRLAIALFASEEDYRNQSNAVRRAWLDVSNGESFWRVENLPEGEYALIAYQDLNGNGQIDMRVLGMPKEPVGVSNDARGLFGPPGFKAARFRIAGPLTRHEFTLR